VGSRVPLAFGWEVPVSPLWSAQSRSNMTRGQHSRTALRQRYDLKFVVRIMVLDSVVFINPRSGLCKKKKKKFTVHNS
jgi:hypothetical protein